MSDPRADAVSPGAMLVEKPEDVVGPDGCTEIPERVAVHCGLAKRRINLNLVCLVRLFHYFRQNPARREVEVVCSLEKENGRICILNRTSHTRLQFRCQFPTLSACCRRYRGTVIPFFSAKHGLDAPKGVPGHCNTIRLHEGLLS